MYETSAVMPFLNGAVEKKRGTDPQPSITARERTMIQRQGDCSTAIAVAFGSIVGTAFFLLFVGPNVLNPTNIAWMSDGDPVQHYLGWLFYRQAPWSFPLGLNPSYGLEMGSSIVFADMLPLGALLFKPLEGFLPATFQYMGFWLLACYVLQGVAAYKLVNLFVPSQLYTCLAAAFFVISPPMMMKLRGHPCLVGHFLIVFALYFLLSKRHTFRVVRWLPLIIVASLSHAYLWVMVLFLWGVDLILLTARTRLQALKAIGTEAAIVLSVMLMCMYAVGYFEIGGKISGGGYGTYRFNLTSFFDPFIYSHVQRQLPRGPYDYEGFAYLGAGMLGLFALLLPGFLEGRSGFIRAMRQNKLLLLACLGLTAYAMTHRLGMGTQTFEVPVPQPFLNIAEIFRASGRMIWPVYYLITLMILLGIFRSYPKYTAASVVAMALVFQTVDTSAGWYKIRQERTMRPVSQTWDTRLKSPFWAEAAKYYGTLRYVPARNHPPDWQALGYYAGNNGMQTDAVHLVRIDPEALEATRELTLRAIKSGNFDPNTLYILEEHQTDEVWATLEPARDHVEKVDGLSVFAPYWHQRRSKSRN